MYHYGMKTERCDNYVPGSIKVSNITDKQWTLQHVLVRTDDVAECTKFPQTESSKQCSGVSPAPSAALLSSDLHSST